MDIEITDIDKLVSREVKNKRGILFLSTFSYETAFARGKYVKKNIAFKAFVSKLKNLGFKWTYKHPGDNTPIRALKSWTRRNPATIIVKNDKTFTIGPMASNQDIQALSDYEGKAMSFRF